MVDSPRSPIAVRMIDLTKPLEAIAGLSRYTAVRVFLRRSDRLLGTFDILTDGAASVSVERLKLAIAADECPNESLQPPERPGVVQTGVGRLGRHT